MLSGNIMKIISKVLFLFCLLQIFELVLIINDMNKTEKLETEIKNNLKMLKNITELLNEHLECMDLKHLKYKEIKIK
ncbi:hypothetical protein VN0401_08130 [Helicobacter pylori]|nr:hypothetical protein VN0401_08130 [Helicobacter pylori]